MSGETDENISVIVKQENNFEENIEKKILKQKIIMMYQMKTNMRKFVLQVMFQKRKWVERDMKTIV